MAHEVITSADEPREVLIRFHEIALKGKNQHVFVEALVQSIKESTRGLGVARVWAERMIVRLSLLEGADWKLVKNRIETVSGVAKFRLAHKVNQDYLELEQFTLKLISPMKFKSFRITSNRSDKRFPMTSPEINTHLGTAVRLASGAHVDLVNPELNIQVEILPNEIFVSLGSFVGPGGLPVGTGGRTITLMSGGIDSPVAAWRMIHRGCHTNLVHFHSFPLVEGRSRDKAKELAEILTSYQYDTRLYLVPFADLQKEILLTIPGPFRIIVYRRFMIRISEAIAKNENAVALITGESLGQVGSQTLQNIATIDQVSTIPVLRPLVGMDKQEIITQALSIGTYGVSIMPDEDCCSLFVPRSPATKVLPDQIQSLENTLEIERLVNTAVENAQVLDFRWVNARGI